jgi:hypothetical protein
MGNSLGNFIWQIGQFQFANMGPYIDPMGPDIQVMPTSCGFDYCPIAADAIPAIRLHAVVHLSAGH